MAKRFMAERFVVERFMAAGRFIAHIRVAGDLLLVAAGDLYA
jgi:hypothetical protein